VNSGFANDWFAFGNADDSFGKADFGFARADSGFAKAGSGFTKDDSGFANPEFALRKAATGFGKSKSSFRKDRKPHECGFPWFDQSCRRQGGLKSTYSRSPCTINEVMDGSLVVFKTARMCLCRV
jgi:hypothetical protein